MRDHDDRSGINHQAVAERKYASVRQAVESAGYFAPHVIADHMGDHITCNSKYRADYGYAGRIVFVTEIGGNWYIATPHPYHYRVLDSSQAAQAVVAFLDDRVKFNRDGEIVTGDEVLIQLVAQIDYTEYEQAIGQTKHRR